MKQLERSALVSYSAEQMYRLVNDVESYPEFVKGCKKATILAQSEDSLTAKLDLQSKGIHQSFTTKNALKPNQAIHMQLVDGPFKKLDGLWTFEAIEDNACKVTFTLKFEFANFFLGLAAGKLMDDMANTQVEAMVKRAEVIYGKKP